MADHHDAYNSMLQMNGLGLVHHLNGAPQPPPPVEMNGSVPQDVHRNGNTTPGQHQQNSGTLSYTITPQETYLYFVQYSMNTAYTRDLNASYFVSKPNYLGFLILFL